MQSALSVYMGSEAAKTIGERGWQAAPFSTLIGASGGPKWLILSELDKVLGQALLLGRSEPMTLLGSSIGTWRHACLSLNDPGAAISRLQQAYLYQEYSCARPSPIEVSEVAERMLREALGPEGAQQVAAHPTLRNAIVTARAKRGVKAVGVWGWAWRLRPLATPLAERGWKCYSIASPFVMVSSAHCRLPTASTPS